jgi:type II secretion system protein N
MTNGMKRTAHIALLVGLFFGSFLLFLFLTFPYEVLKESVAAEISQATGYNIRIGDLSPNLPIGITAEKIRVEPPGGGSPLTLDELTVELGVFKLLLAKLAIDVTVVSGPGELEVETDIGIYSLLGGGILPNQLYLEATNFPIDQIADFGLGLAGGPGANPMVAPLITALGVSGSLNGKVDFDLNTKNPTQSSGFADLALSKAILKLSHPSLGLPDQEFIKAQIKARVENGTVQLDKSSGFVSEELELLPEGKIVLKPDAFMSQLDLNIVFRLNKGLKERFGFMIDAITGSATSDGQLTMQVRGPMGEPVVATL